MCVEFQIIIYHRDFLTHALQTSSPSASLFCIKTETYYRLKMKICSMLQRGDSDKKMNEVAIKQREIVKDIETERKKN